MERLPSRQIAVCLLSVAHHDALSLLPVLFGFVPDAADPLILSRSLFHSRFERVGPDPVDAEGHTDVVSCPYFEVR